MGASGNSAVRRRRWIALGLGLPVAILPASAWAQDATKRLSASATIEGTYDTNTLRASDLRFAGPKDNFRVTPRVDVSVNEPIGRIRITADVSAGYDFNTRYKFLNATRIGANGSVYLPVGGTCSVSPSISYFRYQADQADLQVLEDNINQVTGVALEASCKRAAGFSPYVQLRQDTGTNSENLRKVSDYRSRSVTLGLDYNRPSLGTVRLFGSYRKIERPELERLFGLVDGADVESVGLTLIRNIAPRLGGTLSANYTRVDPVRTGVSGYSGFGYSVDLTFRPAPSSSWTGHFERSVTSETSISATYSLTDVLRFNGEIRVSQRSYIDLSASYVHRSLRGESIVIGFLPIGSDSTKSLGAGYRFNFQKRLQLSIRGFYRRRDADNSFYDYDDVGGTTGVTVRF